MPAVRLTPVAKEKLQEYLSEEPSETVVRLLVEDDGRFGLSLDVRASDDLAFQVDDVPFVVEGRCQEAVEGLQVDYLVQGAASGFSLTGGRPLRTGRRVVVSTEPTPNPNAMKFTLAFALGAEGTYGPDAGADSPQVARDLLALEGVASVFLREAFLTVTREEGADWDALTGRVREILERLEPTRVGAGAGAGDDEEGGFASELRQFVRSDVAPFLQADGGDIEIVGVDGGVVKVRLWGACGSCPSSTATLQMGVERRLKERFPGQVQGLQLVS